MITLQKISNANKMFFTAALLCGSVLSVPAQAGFEWNPPKASEPQRKIIVDNYVNKTLEVLGKQDNEVAVEEIVEPEIITESENTPTEAVSEKSEKKALVISEEKPSLKNEKTAEEVIAEHVIEEEPTPTKAEDVYAVAHGFGKDVPLALALRQIVPADFGYAVQDNANLGLRVDWNGAKPWNEVLNMAIEGYDLEAVIIEKTVLIKKVGTKVQPPKAKIPSMVIDDKPLAESANEEKSEMVYEDIKITQNASLNPTKLTTKMNPTTVSQWQASKGDDLYPVLVQWCNASGVKLFWNVKDRFELPENIHVEGDFEMAIQRLLMAFKGHKQRPVGQFKEGGADSKALLSISSGARS